MGDHQHLTASKDRKDGTTDRHRYTVATEYVDAEAAVAREMGYRLKHEVCYDDCLARSARP